MYCYYESTTAEQPVGGTCLDHFGVLYAVNIVYRHETQSLSGPRDLLCEQTDCVDSTPEGEGLIIKHSQGQWMCKALDTIGDS